MRKDVRFGLAIGGVLLAVLIAYVLVVPGESGSRQAAGIENPSPSGGQPSAAVPSPVPPTPVSQTPAPQTPAPQAPPAPAPSAPTDAPAVADANRTPRANVPTDWAQLLAFGETRQQTAPAPTPVPPADDNRSAAAAPTAPEAPRPQPSSAASEAPPAPAGRAGTYVVRAGDTLSSIARQAYGSPNYYPHIQRANPKLDPRKLRPGMTINLPDKAEVVVATAPPTTAPSAPAAPATDSARQYTVREGDSLYRISVRLYGDAAQADRIYERNRQAIGSDPARLKVGMVLELPQPPTVVESARN